MTDPAAAYCESVLSGDVLAGRLVKLACERHLRDLDEASRRGLLWKPEDGLLAIEFVELHHHFKGRWAKVPCTCDDDDPSTCARRLVPEPWQAFCLMQLFGWKRRREEDGAWINRFTVAYIQVARKNGKTHFGLPVGHYKVFGESEPSAEGYIGATAGHQSRMIHNIAKRMIRVSPALRSKLSGWDQKLANIYRDSDGSFLEPVSSESGTLDGLGPQFILLDELHEHRNASLREVLKTGMGARDEPLLLEITTAGEEREGSVCKAERDYGERVLEQDIEDEQFFAYIAELDPEDDWTDVSVYQKSNPSLGVTVRREELEKSIHTAIHNPLLRDAHRIKRAGQWLSVFSGMFSAEDWKRCDGRLDLEALRGKTAYAGVDLAEKLDMSALALVFPPESEEDAWRVRVFYWLPARQLEAKSLDRPALLAWKRAGYIEIAGEVMMANEVIRQRIAELAELYRIPEIGFDPWKATQLAQDLESDGFMMVQVRQGHRTLSEATDELVAATAAGRFNYDNNPVLRWNAGNCVARADENNNRIPSKKRSRGNIDGVSATITAMSRALVAVQQQGYATAEPHGLLVV